MPVNTPAEVTQSHTGNSFKRASSSVSQGVEIDILLI